MENLQVTKTLNSLLENEATLPQAYLFLGSSELGTTSRTIVEDFASRITNGNTSSMDLVRYNPQENSGIETIRDVLELASLMPAQGKRKVVVMLNMQLANIQMQNALLKILEEPPKHTLFLLVSRLPLLPTIMSRCQVFTIPRVVGEIESSDELTAAMQSLEQNRSTGHVEKTALAIALSELEDDLLTQLVEHWIYKQVSELNTAPEKYKAVRVSLETLESLKGNFNKKMVLHKFVTHALI
jgi:DNA polymerase III delta prime subunit